MKKTPLSILVRKGITRYLQKRGYSEYAVASVTEQITNDLLNVKNIPLRKRLWALKHGFFSDNFCFYDLSEENYQNYLSDLDYYWLHPLNGIFSHLIDDKLSLRYLLFPFSEYLPKYYFHISVKGTLRLMDCPKEYNADNQGVIDLLKESGALAIKSLIGSAGSGFVKLAYSGGEFLVNDKPSSERELIKMLYNWRLSNSGYIITEFLIPHPDIRRIWDKTDKFNQNYNNPWTKPECLGCSGFHQVW